MLKLFSGAACIGFAPLFVRFSTMAPTPIGAYRCLIAGLILLFVHAIFTPTAFRSSVSRFRQMGAYIFIPGILFVADLYAFHRAVIYAGAGIGTILANTQVFHVAIFDSWSRKKFPRVLFVLSMIVAFIGVALLVNPQESSVDKHYWWGLGYGTSTGFIYASYLLSMRRLQQKNPGLPLSLLIGWVSLVTGVGLLLISVFEHSLVLPSNGRDWFSVIGLAVVAQILGWYLITHHLPHVSKSQGSLALLTQPLVATIGGILFFQEPISTIKTLGATLALAGIYVGSRSSFEN